MKSQISLLAFLQSNHSNHILLNHSNHILLILSGWNWSTRNRRLHWPSRSQGEYLAIRVVFNRVSRNQTKVIALANQNRCKQCNEPVRIRRQIRVTGAKRGKTLTSNSRMKPKPLANQKRCKQCNYQSELRVNTCNLAKRGKMRATNSQAKPKPN